MKKIFAPSCGILVSALVISGCGGGGGSSSQRGTTAAKLATKNSAAALAGYRKAANIGTAGILEVSIEPLSTGESDDVAFSDSGTQVIDLDVKDLHGHDLYPEDSGRIRVTWDGSSVDSEPVGTGGIASYHVAIEFLTETSFGYPDNGGTATIAADSAISYDLEITWDQDGDRLSLSWDMSLAADHFGITIDRADEKGMAIIDGSTHSRWEWSGPSDSGDGPWEDTDGEWSDDESEDESADEDVAMDIIDRATDPQEETFAFSISAHWTIDVTEGGETHHIVWNQDDDEVSISVDGGQKVTYTPEQACEEFGCPE
jgi:hypothetical protein